MPAQPASAGCPIHSAFFCGMGGKPRSSCRASGVCRTAGAGCRTAGAKRL